MVLKSTFQIHLSLRKNPKQHQNHHAANRITTKNETRPRPVKVTTPGKFFCVINYLPAQQLIAYYTIKNISGFIQSSSELKTFESLSR